MASIPTAGTNLGHVTARHSLPISRWTGCRHLSSSFRMSSTSLRQLAATPREIFQRLGGVITVAKRKSGFAELFLNNHGELGRREGVRKSRTANHAVRELTGSILQGEGLRIAVVAARFNEIITRPLVAGALETFKKYAIKDDDVDVIWVPGSFEIPLVCQQLAKSGKFDAVLAIGAVIRGATTHYDAVAGSAASGLTSAGLNSGVPVIFGVLTTENLEQAIDRAGGKLGNKGAEAALTTIEMASLFRYQIIPLTKHTSD